MKEKLSNFTWDVTYVRVRGTESTEVHFFAWNGPRHQILRSTRLVLRSPACNSIVQIEVAKASGLISQYTVPGNDHVDLQQQSLRCEAELHEAEKLLFFLQFVVTR